MARSKFQEGSMFIEGEAAKRKYVTRFRVYDLDGGFIKKKVTLRLVSSLSKRDANRLRTEVVAKYTAQLPQATMANKAEMTFEKFYNERFLPLKTHWSEPHSESFKYVIDSFVLPKFGKLAISTIDKVMVQSRLNSLVPGYSESTISHVRRKMVEVFEEAVEQEYINRNPATKTKMPAGAREPEQPVLSEEQLIGIIDKLTDAKDKAIFLTGTFCAMRCPGATSMRATKRVRATSSSTRSRTEVNATTARKPTPARRRSPSPAAPSRQSSSGRRSLPIHHRMP
jgi:hypothetical protein